jgi:hypothetical protein
MAAAHESGGTLRIEPDGFGRLSDRLIILSKATMSLPRFRRSSAQGDLAPNSDLKKPMKIVALSGRSEVSGTKRTSSIFIAK